MPQAYFIAKLLHLRIAQTSFFISEATSFCGQRPQLCLVPYNREGTETIPYRLLCFFLRADGIRPYLCLVPYALCINNRVRVPPPTTLAKPILHMPQAYFIAKLLHLRIAQTSFQVRGRFYHLKSSNRTVPVLKQSRNRPLIGKILPLSFANAKQLPL